MENFLQRDEKATTTTKNKQKKNQQKVRCERKSYNNQPSRMAKDGEEKSDLKITNYRG